MSQYYKILPDSLICRGFQYQEGLNIHPKGMKPCVDADGFYFSDAAHILQFCDVACKRTNIAEVELPEDAVICHSSRYQYKADKIILKNIRPLWCTKTLEDLIKNGVNILQYKDPIFYDACQFGVMDVVRCFVEHGVDIHSLDEWALSMAILSGRLDIVQYLVDHGADVHAGYGWGLYLAAAYGCSKVLEYLIEQGVDISGHESMLLSRAAFFDDVHTLQLLLDHGVDIHTDNDIALKTAEKFDRLNAVEFLVKNGANISACREPFVH